MNCNISGIIFVLILTEIKELYHSILFIIKITFYIKDLSFYSILQASIFPYFPIYRI